MNAQEGMISIEEAKRLIDEALTRQKEIYELLLSEEKARYDSALSIIRERQRWGIAAAKKAGKHLGRTASLSAEQVKEIKDRVGAGESKKALAAEYGVSRPTLYAALGRV